MRGLVTILFSCCLNSAFCQSFATFNYSVAAGVPSAETYEVFQDSKGFLWFGTDNGICRFDGKNIEAFNVKDGLSDPVVFGISEDHLGRIWFRTYSGKISYFQDNKIHTYRYNDILSRICEKQIMSSLHCDTLNQVWFAIGPFIGKIDTAGKLDTIRLKRHTLQVKSIENTTLLASFGPPQQVKAFSHQGKIYPLVIADTLHNYHVHCREVRDGKLYLTINNSIFEFDGKILKRVYAGRAPIISLYRDSQNHMWVGYMREGAERFTGSFDKPDLKLFQGKSVTKVRQDHEGGFWMTTLENGVYYIPNLSIRNFVPDSFSKIKAVVSAGEIIITGDYTGRINAFNSVTGKILWEKKLKEPIISVLRTIKGNLWVSTTNRTYIYDSLFNLKKKFAGSRLSLMGTDDGKIMGISGNMVVFYDDEANVTQEHRGASIYRSAILRDSLLFLATRTGLRVLDGDFKILKDPETLKDIRISQLLNLSDSILLACTVGNGFFLLNTKTWTTRQFNSGSNFNADNIYTAFTTDSLLWLGTEKGLVVATTTSVVNNNIQPEFLTKRSGLVSDKINFLVKGVNSIWAFTEEGISIIHYPHETFVNRTPLFFINRITVNDKITDIGSNLVFATAENNIEFDYRYVSFNNPDLLLRYRLSSDEPWVYNNNSNLLFSSLAPGKYKLELEYSADNIRWTAAISSITFTIRPPWWNLWYVQLFAFIVLAAFGYWYFKYQRSIYKQKNLYLEIINEHQQKLIQSEVVALERERNRIAKELHDRVGTNLTAIKLIVSQLLKTHMEPLAQEVEDQFQIAISEIKEIIYGLTPPSLERYGLFTGLKNYVGKLNRTIPINISLKTYGKDTLNYELNLMIFRVLQELISNTIKHSFAKNITIHINAFEDMLSIVYEDDGIGFSYDPLQSGLGLDNIESRIHSVNGTLKFDSGKFGISYTIDIPTNLNKEVV